MLQIKKPTKKKQEGAHTHPQHLAGKGGMHPPEMFHVFNILIGKEEKRERAKRLKNI